MLRIFPICYQFRKNKFIFIFISLILLGTPLFSQRMIEVKYEADPKGGYVFSCYNYAYCNYILSLGFTSFDNLRCDKSLPYHAEIKPGYNKLFTISPVDPQAAVKFKYNSGFQKGCMYPVITPDFTYLFPITPGKDAQVYEMSPDKSNDSSFWYVLRLKMKPGDTIYAARKGVINIIEDQSSANDAGQASIGKENFIEIVQPDCSFTRYGILKKNSALVKPGQAVKAGQPIGLVGGDSYGRGAELRFSLYYYQEESEHQSSASHFMIPQIWTKNNGRTKLKHGAVYISEFPATVLNQENPVATPKKKKSKKK